MGVADSEDPSQRGVGLMPLVWVDPTPEPDLETRVTELEARVTRLARRVKALEDAP